MVDEDGVRDSRYPTDGLRHVEANAARVRQLLPDATFERTRDVFQFEWHGEEGVVLLVTAEALELRLPTVEWTKGAYGATSTSRVWKRVKWERLEDDEQLDKVIRAAVAARAREFVRCPFCGTPTPPEHRIQGNVCHGCASDRHGVVF